MLFYWNDGHITSIYTSVLYIIACVFILNSSWEINFINSFCFTYCFNSLEQNETEINVFNEVHRLTIMDLLWWRWTSARSVWCKWWIDLGWNTHKFTGQYILSHNQLKEFIGCRFGKRRRILQRNITQSVIGRL